MFLMVYFGINVAAMAGPLVGGQLGEAVGFGLVFGLSAAVCLVSALLAAGVGGVHHRVGTKPQPGTFGAGPVLGAIVLLVLSLPYFLGMGALGTLQVAATPFGEPGSDGLPFVALNPIVISLVTLFAAVGFAVAAFMKARPMSLYVAGGGLLVFALGLGAGAFVEPESGLGVALLLAIVLTAIGEGLTGGVVLARVAADVHPRLGTLVFALFLVLSSGAPYLASFANEVESVRIAVGVCALFSFGAGAVLLAVAGPMQRAFYSPRDEATPTGAESAP
ncbi:MAG: hypothetical protein DRJ42_11920 [Deltaproteobacteria bacterium]|nr:MAG: hypothetical protein DRJ42_11920 [Deltaproteobacteria bacterium]